MTAPEIEADDAIKTILKKQNTETLKCLKTILIDGIESNLYSQEDLENFSHDVYAEIFNQMEYLRERWRVDSLKMITQGIGNEQKFDNIVIRLTKNKKKS